jgi:hypothetical protein
MLLRDGELPSSDALADFQKVLHERYEVKRDIRLMMILDTPKYHFCHQSKRWRILLLERLLSLGYIQSSVCFIFI